jgi:hypothetical protein
MNPGARPPLIAPATRPLLIRVVIFTALIFAALEFWRPYYFLTDDNLSVGLPFLTEMGRHLKHGESPFYSDYLFGGHYDLLRDANYFSWHPMNFAVSLLADTPAHFAMLDVVAAVHIFLSAVGFALLGATVRDELGLAVSNGRILFLTLSFTFSTFILTTGASWVNFLGNQAVLPWLALGLWQTRWRRGLAVLVIFSLHQALGGQSAGTISNGLILTLFALLLCSWRRSPRPLLMWAAANAITLVLILPVLLPALGGFFHSQRGAGISVDSLQKFAMPLPLVPIALLFGNYFEMAAHFAKIPAAAATFFMFPRLPTLLACAAAWCIFPLVCQRRRWTLLEGGCAAIMAVILLLVVRPVVITELMTHVPLLRSMRWPFREILQLLFFFHLLLLLRPWAGTPQLQNRLACFSAGLFALPLLFTAPLTLNSLREDRAILFTGVGDRYWTHVKALLGPDDEVATVIDPKVWAVSLNTLNYTLIGTADFPAYFQFRCISGYSQTAPVNQLADTVRPYFWFGAYSTDQVPALIKKHPHLRVIDVYSFYPLRLSLSSPHGPIDLLPMLYRE